MSTRDLQGFPRGWFVVAGAGEVPERGVQRLTAFGRELVMFRGESGAVAILDAFCPHLGAHLGVGGTVAGDGVRCPFHAWVFGADGRCVDIPYAKKVPKQAKVRAWAVRERNGLVFLWHDPAGGEPDWEIPVIPEVGDAGWLPWNLDCIRVRTHPREIVENVADKAHFPEVHGTHVDHFENEYVDHMAIQRTRGIAYPRGGGQDPFSLTATYYGPGYQITEMDGVLKNRLLLAHTPVDATTLDLRFGVMLKVFGADSDKTARFAERYIDNLRTGFHEDLRVWENKQWRDPPLLCDGDGPIGRLRAWYRQFYVEAA